MKMTTLPYWGQINALVSQENVSIFTTYQSHQEKSNDNYPVLYRIDSSKEPLTLQKTPLPCAVHAMCALADSTIIMVGQDGHLYQTDWQGKKLKKVSDVSSLDLISTLVDETNSHANMKNHPAVAMAALEGAIAVLYSHYIMVWQYQKHQVGDCLTILPLVPTADASYANRATALATSSDGKWLVIGNSLGQVTSYQWLALADKSSKADTALAFSSQATLHEGKINALCFEPVGQYFFSAGTDKKLLRTHVQGDLHPLDRAKSSSHTEMITALLVSDNRLYTGADDKSIKSWGFDKGQPNQCKEGLGKIRQLGLVQYLGQPAIIAACTDQSLRYVLITDNNKGKIGEVTHTIEDGYVRVKLLLTDNSAHADVAFNEALELLNTQVDNQNLKLVEKVLSKLTAKDGHKIEQLITWVAHSQLDKASNILEKQLNNKASKRGRQIAFDALSAIANQHLIAKKQQLKDKSNNEPLTLDRYYDYLGIALESKHEDMAKLAVDGYFDFAKQSDEQKNLVLPILQNVLCHNNFANVRQQALVTLEDLLPKDSPKADLMALTSDYDDIKQAGLIRLYQRNMLSLLEVRRQVALSQSHKEPNVRKAAFYVSILAEPKLTEALKHASQQLGDTQLQRVLQDFNDFRLSADTYQKNKDKPSSKNTNPTNNNQKQQTADKDFLAQDFATIKKRSQTIQPANLSNDEIEPLLQGLTNSYADIAFYASYALACLQDKRAFASLIRLMSNNDKGIRAGVAIALANLSGVESKDILPVLLNDKIDSVRQTAMNAYGKIADSALQWASVGFASKYQDIHERALAIFLTQAQEQKPSDNQTISEEMTSVLLQALNNPFDSIRLEAVKVLLNRVIHQSQPAQNSTINHNALNKLINTLKLSQYDDVHQIALTEWEHQLLHQQESRGQTTAEQKQINNEQNLQILSLFLADKFGNIRDKAFHTALKQKSMNIAEVINAALNSPFLDTCTLALNEIEKHASAKVAEQILPNIIGLFNHDSQNIRTLALEKALYLSKTVSHEQYSNMLTSALASPYEEIQLKSATLLAQQNQLNQLSSFTDTYADANHKAQQEQTQQEQNCRQAYAIFEKYLSTPMPTVNKNIEAYRQWQSHIHQSLKGLAILCSSFTEDGNVSQLPQNTQNDTTSDHQPTYQHAFDWFVHYLDHADADFTNIAPLLMWVARPNLFPEHLNKLISWQGDERDIISQSATVALAVWGESQGKVLFSTKSDGLNDIKPPLSQLDWLQARNGLGIENAELCNQTLGKKHQILNIACQLLLVFYDVFDTHSSQPQRLINSLSFINDKTAIVFANVLARFQQIPKQDNSKNKTNDFIADTGHIQPLVWQYLSNYLNQVLKTQLTQFSLKNHIQEEFLATITAQRLYELARQILFANPLRKAHAIEALYQLSELACLDNYSDTTESFSKKAYSWQRLFVALTDNSAGDIHNLLEADSQSQAHYPYQHLAFGTWLDIVRQANYYEIPNAKSAIHSLLWLAKQPYEQSYWQDSVGRVLLPLLSGGFSDLQDLIWDSLQQLNVPNQKISEQAMTSPTVDMVKKGLTLLVNNTEKTDEYINEQLIKLLQSNSIYLVEEVYRLLKKRIGNVQASLHALNAYSLTFRHQMVSEWQSILVDSSPEENSLLLQSAINNDDLKTRYLALAQFTDSHIYQQPNEILTALFNLWRNMPTPEYQKNVLDSIHNALTALQQQKDKPQSSKAEYTDAYQKFSHQLLDLIDAPEAKIKVETIYQIIGLLHDNTLAPKLLQKLQDSYQNTKNGMSKHERNQLIHCITTISGYDQNIVDYEELEKSDDWQDKQYPRHPSVLLDLFNVLLSATDYDKLNKLLGAIAWVGKEKETHKLSQNDQAINQQIDLALERAYDQTPDSKPQYRRHIVEAMVYRADKRQGSLTGLRKALQSREPDIQFLSAEALAKQGNFEGLSIIMATIDYNTDGELRRRAVLALGELLNNAYHKEQEQNDSNKAYHAKYIHTIEQAYDRLIKLAQNNEHYLSDVASEALGRLSQNGNFKYSDTIFDLLKTQLQNLHPWNDACRHCLNGLRWLNTTAAWEEIRQYIPQCAFYSTASHAITLLRYATQPLDIEANKAFILDIIKQSGENNNTYAYQNYSIYLLSIFKTAQALWHKESTESTSDKYAHVYPYDWAMLLSCDPLLSNQDEIEQGLSLKRICQSASIDELTDFIYRYQYRLDDNIKKQLINSILNRQDMPIDTLQQLISSDSISNKNIGLNYLNLYQNNYIDTDMMALLWQQFTLTQQQWANLCDKAQKRPALTKNTSWLEHSKQIANIIQQILWLLVRHNPNSLNKASTKASKQQLNELWTWLIDTQTNPVLSASTSLSTLVDNWWKQALLAQIANLSAPKQDKPDTYIAEPLLEILTAPEIAWLNNDTKKLLAQIQAIIHQSAQTTAKTLTTNQADTAKSNTFAEQSPYQQLLTWIKANDSESLMEWAFDKHLNINLRLQAIESLSQLHDLRIGEWLQTLIDTHQRNHDDNAEETYQDNGVNQEIAKTAYKVLRRWQRAIIRQQQKQALSQSGAVKTTHTKIDATSDKGE